MATREEVLKDGGKFYCIACHNTYKELPTEEIHYQCDHYGEIPMCRCGSDLFAKLEDDSPIKY